MLEQRFCKKCEGYNEETSDSGYMTNNKGKKICFQCVGYSEALTIVRSKGGLGQLNPLGLKEFSRYQGMLALVRHGDKT